MEPFAEDVIEPGATVDCGTFLKSCVFFLNNLSKGPKSL